MDVSGFLNVNKCADMTSHDVIAITRRAFSIKKAGHTGTLDPMATGVLPVAIGRATKFIKYLEDNMKTYEAELLFGIETDTADITGEITSRSKLSDSDFFDRVNEVSITNALEEIRERGEQVPPAYSAIKVNGKRLYKYARDGKTPEINPRKVCIKSIDADFSLLKTKKKLRIKVVCGRGTYIRSIITDLGRALDTGATMTKLTRTSEGAFSIENAIDIMKIRAINRCNNNGKSDDKEEVLLSAESMQRDPVYADFSLKDIIASKSFFKIDEALPFLKSMNLNPKTAVKFLNGAKIHLDGTLVDVGKKESNVNFEVPRDEGKEIYKIYSRKEEKPIFIGVGSFDTRTETLKPLTLAYTEGKLL